MNVCISYMVLSIVLPLLEHFLNIPTVFRLHELCLADTPVLSRLRSQAVGTYNHVNNVSDMAYHAAKEIGVNSEVINVPSIIGVDDYSLKLMKTSNGAAKILTFDNVDGLINDYRIKFN